MEKRPIYIILRLSTDGFDEKLEAPIFISDIKDMQSIEDGNGEAVQLLLRLVLVVIAAAVASR